VEYASRARAATGIQDLEFRRWRTTFATLYDGDPRDLQAILGHSRLDMTMKRYKKPIAVRQQADVEELEARLSRKWSGCLRGGQDAFEGEGRVSWVGLFVQTLSI
jgi:integrase